LQVQVGLVADEDSRRIQYGGNYYG